MFTINRNNNTLTQRDLITIIRFLFSLPPSVQYFLDPSPFTGPTIFPCINSFLSNLRSTNHHGSSHFIRKTGDRLQLYYSFYDFLRTPHPLSVNEEQPTLLTSTPSSSNVSKVFFFHCKFQVFTSEKIQLVHFRLLFRSSRRDNVLTRHKDPSRV